MKLTKNTVKRVVSLASVIMVTLTLVGCGGEGEGSAGSSAGSTAPNIQSATLSAENATYSTGYTELFEVDLSSKVFSSTGGGFTLSEIEVLSNDHSCQVESMTETGFRIQASDTKVCDYRYHVTPKTSASMSRLAETPAEMSDNSEGSSFAVTRIAVSSDPSSTELTPISASTLINEGLNVSLKAELEKVGFMLGDEFVLTELTLPFGYSSSVQINDLDDQVLEYTPEQGFTGIDRVLYTLEDSMNGLVLMGVLDIAVGYEANQGFTIDENIVYPEVVDVFIETEIDISDFVSSDDGDDYQVVYVETFNAEAASKDPLDTSNKIIVFQASQPGFHYISFGVSDHKGVYDMGLIRVQVTDPNQSSKWDDVYHLADMFSGPPTALDAAGQGTPYDIKLSDGAYSPVIDMAGFRYQSAVAYCDTIGGALPSVAKLTQMTAAIDLQLFHNWPVQAQYLAFDEVADLPMIIDLTDGVTSTTTVDPTAAYYVTCIQQGFIEVLPSSSTEVVANGVDVGSVFVELKLGQELRPDAIIAASVSSPNVTLESDTVTTGPDGIAEFRLTSFKAETVTLTFDVEGFIDEYDITFVGDEKTAAVSSETTINDQTYTSVEGNQITATLKDQNDNPVEGYTITSTVDTELHPNTGESVTPILEAETSQTDEVGEQKVRVKWNPVYEIPTFNMTFDVTSSYTTTTNTQTDAISQVTFNAYMCGGQIGDDDKNNAAGACIKISQQGSALATSSPSVAFLDLLGYSGSRYGDVWTEDGSKGPEDGEFGRFNLYQAAALCDYFNEVEFQGLVNWQLASLEQAELFYDSRGDMFAIEGWPTGLPYWTSTSNGGSGSLDHNLTIDLAEGGEMRPENLTELYVSCVAIIAEGE
ncbi:hypothetical protein BCU33_013115 [Vibrio lentus]|uniref:hypothetical protein n=1 Tax=Vibrio lentus TaxID=136468 RepID=UPI00101AD0AC|nr:hypothetical protein [Vibrio lentus]MCC4784512.1 hypothetical protein [Vibrio lentus]TKG19613.1 hypothetical protein FCW05_09005 [Vibrio lentus]